MISTSTVAMWTHFAPRWLAALGYLLAVLLLLGSPFLRWSFALFPLWVLLLSVHILAGSLGRRPRAEAGRGSLTRSWCRRYSTTFQLASGLNSAIEAPRAAVFGPRSFW